LGTPLRVLSGEEEASAAYRGAITAFGALHGERCGVIDTGGGSTEYAIGTGTAPERVLSCEIGAVRLTEALPALAGRDGAVDGETIGRGRTLAREALAPMAACDPIERAAIVGGSATNAAMILRGRRSSIGSFAVTRADLQRVLAQLCAIGLEERKRIPGIKPQRADILPGGIIVVDAALEIAGLDSATATTSDLLLGVALQHRDAAGGTPGFARAGSARKRW
jgi:exopolyphosphatase/guanosine-5'-triphosphate,3'-diphosphate pyrophosphatase